MTTQFYTEWTGIKNVGSTCYLNSVLQMMLAVNRKNDTDMAKVTTTPEYAIQYEKLRTAFNKTLEMSEGVTIKPSAFVKLWSKHFRLGIQHDAHEFFINLIEKCGFDFSKFKIKTIIKKENEEDSLTEWDAYHLLLSIKNSSDLQILINNYSQEVELEDATTKKDILLTAPNVLFIQVKRWNEDTLQRLSTNITLPDSLMLKVQDKDYKYKLKAYVHHFGASTDSGHYICDLNDDKNWIRVNDTIVVKREKDSKSNTAYILAYIKDESN